MAAAPQMKKKLLNENFVLDHVALHRPAPFAPAATARISGRPSLRLRRPRGKQERETSTYEHLPLPLCPKNRSRPWQKFRPQRWSGPPGSEQLCQHTRGSPLLRSSPWPPAPFGKEPGARPEQPDGLEALLHQVPHPGAARPPALEVQWWRSGPWLSQPVPPRAHPCSLRVHGQALPLASL